MEYTEAKTEGKTYPLGILLQGYACSQSYSNTCVPTLHQHTLPTLSPHLPHTYPLGILLQGYACSQSYSSTCIPASAHSVA